MSTSPTAPAGTDDTVQPRLASALLGGAELCTQHIVDPPLASISIDDCIPNGPMTAHCHLKNTAAITPLVGIQNWAAALGDAARIVVCRHEQDREFVSLSAYVNFAETEFRVWTHAYPGAEIDRLWQVLGDIPDVGEPVAISAEQLYAATEQDECDVPEDQAEVPA